MIIEKENKNNFLYGKELSEKNTDKEDGEDVKKGREEKNNS